MAGWFELKNSEKQFMFNLKGANSETVLTSEGYVTKAGAEGGIASVKLNAPFDARDQLDLFLHGGKGQWHRLREGQRAFCANERPDEVAAGLLLPPGGMFSRATPNTP